MHLPRRRNAPRLPWLLAAAALVVVALAADAFARAGGGGNFGGGGGGGDGGGGGGGDGGAIIWLLFQLVRLAWVYPPVGVPLLLMFLYGLWWMARKGRQARTSSVLRRGRVAGSANAEAALLAKLRARDAAFDGTAFGLRVQAAFRTAQSAWCAHDLTPIRPFVSDGVHERFSLQIDEQKALGYRDLMVGLTVDDVVLVAAEFEGAFDTITVAITATATEARVAIADGKRVSGGAQGRETFVELWTFARRQGASTKAGRPGLLEGNCPNCGQAVLGNQFADCKSCGARLRSGEFDWVLVEITQAGERLGMVPRAIPGVAELTASDPEFCVQQLEDRASVAFWRWATAMRFGDASPLAGVALPTVLAQVASEIGDPRAVRRWIGECGVGSVELIGVVREGAADTAVVEVRWSGTEFEGKPSLAPRRLARTGIRSWLLVFERAAGATSRLADSFSSSHCKGCGAPASKDAAVCAFCGAALTDVNLGWTLAQMTTRGDAAGRVLLGRLTSAHGPEASAAPEPAAVPAGVLAWAASMAASDGQVDARERAAFLQLAARGGVSAERASQILGDAYAGGEPPMPANAAAAREWLDLAARMALADGVVTPGEMAVLEKLAGPAGMAPADIRLVVSRVRSAMYQEAKAEIAKARGA